MITHGLKNEIHDMYKQECWITRQNDIIYSLNCLHIYVSCKGFLLEKVSHSLRFDVVLQIYNSYALVH